MKTINIGSTVIDVPDFLETRVENDELVAYPPLVDFINVRFHVLSITKDGKEVPNAGVDMVQALATEARARLIAGTDRVWYYLTKPATEASGNRMMFYWHVGMGGHTLVVSCFVDAAQTSNPLTKRILESIEATIKAFRRKAK